MVPPPAAAAPSETAKSVEKEARALIERWVAAQNDGNFDAYASLYADSFRGIRRSRSRTFSFDRAGWLRDRRRMFQKKLEVAADHIALAPRSGSFEVQLTQSFRSGSYSDVGQKQLVLAAEHGRLLIVSEEMLESQAVPVAAAAPVRAALTSPSDASLLEPESESAKKLRELVRSFRTALKNSDLASLQRLLPAKGALEILIKQCIGERCRTVEKQSTWTRAQLTLQAFDAVSPDKDLGDECFDHFHCVGAAADYGCSGGCGGFLGEFSWSRVGDTFFLSLIQYDYD